MHPSGSVQKSCDCPIYTHLANRLVHGLWYTNRVVTKISSCWVNTTSRRGINRLGISFGSIFLPFSNIKAAGGHSLSSQGKSPANNPAQTSVLVNFVPESCLLKSVPFTGKQPRRPETGIKDGFEEMEHKLPLRIFHPEKQAFHRFCCSQKFSAGTTQKGAFQLLSNRIFQKLLVNGKQPQKQLRIEIHQSQSMTSATRLSKHLFPKRSTKMIIPSNNKIFGEWPSPLVWIIQNFLTSVGFDSSQHRH